MVGKWLAKYKNSPETPTPQTDITDTAQVIDLQEEAVKRGYPFRYPLPETCGIGEKDPLDFKFKDGQTVYEPGWWKRLPRGKK